MGTSARASGCNLLKLEGAGLTTRSRIDKEHPFRTAYRFRGLGHQLLGCDYLDVFAQQFAGEFVGEATADAIIGAQSIADAENKNLAHIHAICSMQSRYYDNRIDIVEGSDRQ